MVTELEHQRDDIRVRIHLANLEARERWNELEPKLEDLEQQFEGAADQALQRLREVASALKEPFRELRDKLR
jgi:hypothetical protein